MGALTTQGDPMPAPIGVQRTQLTTATLVDIQKGNTPTPTESGLVIMDSEEKLKET